MRYGSWCGKKFAKFGAAMAKNIQGADPFGDMKGMMTGQDDHAKTQTHACGALTDRGEQHGRAEGTEAREEQSP